MLPVSQSQVTRPYIIPNQQHQIRYLPAATACNYIMYTGGLAGKGGEGGKGWSKLQTPAKHYTTGWKFCRLSTSHFRSMSILVREFWPHGLFLAHITTRLRIVTSTLISHTPPALPSQSPFTGYPGLTLYWENKQNLHVSACKRHHPEE